MTDDVRNLIRFVVDGDIRNAQTQCRIMLEKNVPEKDARFKENELRKLNLLKPELIQLPANLENLLIAEDATNFPESRFLLREEEETVINKLLATRKAALAIKELGIPAINNKTVYCTGAHKHGEDRCIVLDGEEYSQILFVNGTIKLYWQ